MSPPCFKSSVDLRLPNHGRSNGNHFKESFKPSQYEGEELSNLYLNGLCISPKTKCLYLQSSQDSISDLSEGSATS